MRLFLFIGGTGVGKTPLLKKKIAPCKKLFVLDVRDEFGICKKYPGLESDPILSPRLSTDVTKDRSRYIGRDLDIFVKIWYCKRNSNIVIEEATSLFYHGKITDEIAYLITGKIHDMNNIYMCFHAVSKVPDGLFDITIDTVVFLFRTGDKLADVKKKCTPLVPYFEKLQKMEKGKYFMVKIDA